MSRGEGTETRLHNCPFDRNNPTWDNFPMTRRVVVSIAMLSKPSETTCPLSPRPEKPSASLRKSARPFPNGQSNDEVPNGNSLFNRLQRTEASVKASFRGEGPGEGCCARICGRQGTGGGNRISQHSNFRGYPWRGR